MEQEKAKELIKKSISCGRYLKKSEAGNYCCPYCGSGTGPHHSGGLKWYANTNTWTCHACQKSGDVIDLHMKERGLEFNDALEDLAREIGITIDKGGTFGWGDVIPEGKSSFNGKGTASKEKPKGAVQDAPQEAGKAEGGSTPKASGEGMEPPTADYSSYYRECMERLEDPRAKEYLEGRGISLETARRHWVGFDPMSDPAKSRHPTPRIILPTTKAHYVGRAIDPATPSNFAKMNVKGGKPGIFNRGVLTAQDVPTIFVVEGAFDALSVIEAGAEAVALNSTSNAEKMIKALEEAQKKGSLTKATFVICLDNDEAGKKGRQVLRDGLNRLNISFITADICIGCNDPNDALVKDRDAFTKAVNEAVRKAGKKPDNVSSYMSSFMGEDIERFKQERKTGFKNLDEQAGGLYGGLYVLAATSSLGKTTFAGQMADQLAESGNDVLFFSLEQSRLEMVTKSLARTVAKNVNAGGRGSYISSLYIRKGHLPDHVMAAASEYAQKIGDRLSIIEGNFECNVEFIGDYVRKYVKENCVGPVVIVDYLQILQPPADARKGQTTKEVVDQTVTALKRISREFDIPVIAISSVNRNNYLSPIDFEALKESGGIEYTCDVVWGLQLQCLNEKEFSELGAPEKRERIKKEKKAEPRKIELVCLKNRYGISNYSCYFDYHPSQDLYVEDDGTFSFDDELQQPTLRTKAKKKRV